MARFFDRLEPKHRAFIEAQRMFFVASAPSEGGRVNLSPKGLDSFRILDDRTVGYLDMTGSGNETAAHTGENGRLTIMFCAFEGAPLILRLYGRGRAVGPADAEWADLAPRFPDLPGARQLIVLAVESLQTSCGFAVPEYEFKGHRDQLLRWSEKQGPEGLTDYRRKNNARSIDGLPTGVETRAPK